MTANLGSSLVSNAERNINPHARCLDLAYYVSKSKKGTRNNDIVMNESLWVSEIRLIILTSKKKISMGKIFSKHSLD